MKTVRYEILPFYGNPIRVEGARLSFTVQPGRGLDISSLFYKGIPIAFNAPDSVMEASGFEYKSGEFQKYMFFGLLTTCGLENAGPEQIEPNDVIWSQHGSLNLNVSTNIEITEIDNGLKIKGCILGSRFQKHHFNLHRTIVFNDIENTIKVEDEVSNPSERDQVCIMYHYNLGSPFLSSDCFIRLPKGEIIPKNQDAADRIDKLLKVSEPSEEQRPHVFYTDCEYASVYNPKLGIEFLLEKSNDTLSKMDIWKNLRPEQYVMSFEPCNAYPYGRLKQRAIGNAKYLEKDEHISYMTKITIKEGQNA